MTSPSQPRRIRPAEAIFIFLLLLLFPTACSCWPSLPAMIHQGGCGWPQYAAGSVSSSGGGAQSVALPPKTYIAYSHKGDIWIMDNDGKNKKRLTSDPAREFSLSAGYQAEKIWFIRASGNTSETLNYGDVYSCDYDGKNLKRVTAGLKVGFAAVSPNGKSLAISVISPMPDATGSGSPGETADMWLVNAQGTKLTAASPHYNLTGDLEPSVVGGREGSIYAAWSKATDKIVFTFKPDGSSSLGISTRTVYLANADGSGRTVLAKSADQPSFDGFGTSVAVTTGAHWDTMGVARVNTEGGVPVDVLPVASGASLYSTYNPTFITTYEDVKEWPTVVYGKTTHPAAPAQPVNTLEKYRIDDAKTTVLDTREGAENVITNITTDNLFSAIFFQTGKTAGLDVSNATIWSVKPDGTALKMLSVAAGDDDSEPIAAVSYSWYNKGKIGGTNYYSTCHWPYKK